MEKPQSIINTSIEESNEEFQIIKNDIIYTINIKHIQNNEKQRIKISISFMLNNKFQVYESYLDQCPEIEKIDNNENIYQKLLSYMKEEKFEILYENKNEKLFISFKIDINGKEQIIKLFPSSTDDKNKLKELARTNISLERKEKNNQNQDNNNLMEIDKEEKNNNISIPYDNNNSNTNKNNNMNTIEENVNNYHIGFSFHSSIWCMLKLNKIFYIENREAKNLNLVSIGFSNGKILLINLITMKLHQELKTPNTVYSLAQFKDDSKYLLCSLSNGLMIIYILKENKYEEFQVLEKPQGIRRGEINKVITLSDGNIATAERGAVSIWKPKMEEGQKKFEFFKELINDGDTCQLLEVNPQIFTCAIHSSRIILIYQNDGNEYPLLGKIRDIESHGYNSNGMAKINDNIFFLAGKQGNIYVVSVMPIQVIQKIMLKKGGLGYVHFLYNSNDGFIFTSYEQNSIIQFKIISNEDNNFVKLEKFDTIDDVKDNTAIITTEDGKIFYSKLTNDINYGNYFFLKKYKK